MEYVHGGDIYTYRGMTDFSVNLNPFGPSEAVREAAKRSIEKIGQYPDSSSRELRAALAEKLGVAPEHLIFGNGAAELIFLAVQAQKPKRAVLTAPSFAEYRQALEASGCTYEQYRTAEEKNFSLQEDFLELLTEEVDMIFLCSPDNPTGQIIEKELLCRILKRCEEKKIRMVLDECFLDFLPDPGRQTLIKETEKSGSLMILRAFTKIFAIPGLRLGYGICSDRSFLEYMESSRQPWSVSCVAQAAGLAALSEEERTKKTREFVSEERRWMEKKLTEAGVKFFPSQANFILLKSRHDLFSRLKEQGFLIRDCSNYPGLGKGYYRIAVKQRADNKKLLEVLEVIERTPVRQRVCQGKEPERRG